MLVLWGESLDKQTSRSPTGIVKHLPVIMLSCQLIVLLYNAFWNFIIGVCVWVCVGASVRETLIPIRPRTRDALQKVPNIYGNTGQRNLQRDHWLFLSL